jgi:hypothetical protein
METDIHKTIILKVERAVSPTAKYRIILTLILFCICFIAGCSSNIDKQKFREIKSAARAIDEAVGDTTLSYAQFGELLGKLTEELSKATVAVSTKEETAC